MKDRYASPTTFTFWKAFWIHMRPYLLFISGVTGAAGMAVASGFQDDRLVALVAFLSFFFAYGFGQALTDCFQIDTDSISAPYRPLSKGIIGPLHTGVVATLGLIAVSSVLIGLSFDNIYLCLLSIVALATYSFFKRRYWWAGPPYNSIIVACLPIMGYNIFTDPDFHLDLSAWLLVLLAFFSYFNFVLIGYLKDITADRKTGYNTFPVVFGWVKTAWVGDIIALISIVLCLWLCRQSTMGIVIAIAGAIVAIIGQGFLHFTSERTEENAAFSIAATVRSLVLWHLAIIVTYAPDSVLATTMFYIFFEVVLHFRPLKHQI